MSDKECDFCGKLFRDGDIVQANVLAHYKHLKSTRTYAIDKPFECLSMKHHPECFATHNGD